MDKIKGVHIYVNIKNLIKIIKEEEGYDDDLKRTLHRLQTYFVGHTKLIKKYGGKIEKYAGGRSHIIFEINEDSDIDYEKMLKAVVSCFIYNNKIFNNLSKYSSYSKFSVHAGIDYGQYVEYEIDDSINDTEYTTIGGVANNSAKIQSYAPKDYIYVTQKFINQLPSDLQEKFDELTDEEKEEFNQKIRSKRFYKVHYKDLFDEDTMNEIENYLEDVKERVEEEANGLNIKDIKFEDVNKKLSFNNLSLKGRNKRFEGGVICADIRGFTKLFNVDDQNLDDLKEVMKEIYDIMGNVINDTEGTKVQYQGDRIVAVYNDFNGSEDFIVRMLKAAFTLNSKVQDLNENWYIKQKLNNKKISIGIGCAIGKIIATRLGLKGNKDNIILSDAYKKANKGEDNHAESNEIVICKQLKDEIDNIADEKEIPEYMALQELFSAISTTGYYKTDATIEKFEELVSQKRELQNRSETILKADILKNKQGRIANVNLYPWGM
ncbi:adenylate/guanylate cyclase domain-containing protein [Caminicella sporogenes]|uniref:adenylate/guanylate cyclase domain-containing protein n=1 Tax=Caminicella sporogenes TaxID=166485 RepID=UPI00253F751F|nr:adenylate/guanylate cyclase domain-containing protein [Caminicella sporogenes]WIF95473.1 adenylate/guanylate cyclase domain-containing protein [Caminicella sporogenes]